jgi:protein TonB
MIRNRLPNLVDLAFEGRNKEYGAYELRGKYPRYLSFGIVCGVTVLILAVIGPFLYYYFAPVTLMEGGVLYDVEYYSMMTPPEDPNMIPSMVKPLQEETVAPIVSDTVKPENVKQIETNPEKKEEEKEKADSAGKGNSSPGIGPGTGENTGIATVIDVYPRYQGGDEARLYYLRKNTRYPETAIKAGVQGVVMVVFIVELDGSLSSLEVNKGIGGGCDEEALRVTRAMPKWEPGKRAGRAVRVMVRMPIVFRIPGR